MEATAGRSFPPAKSGVRVDGGDAETGTGLEVGAGMRYARGPVTIEGQVRALVAHEESGYEEWGASGAIRDQHRVHRVAGSPSPLRRYGGMRRECERAALVS